MRSLYVVMAMYNSSIPVVNTGRGAIFSKYFKNCDLAVPGSPQRSTLMSPLILCLPPGSFGSPPKSVKAIALLMSS